VERSSRIEQARRRLRVARLSIGVTAAVGFLVFTLAARASHPGTHSSRASSRATTSASDDFESQSDDFSFGSASISPATGGTPMVQSGGS
jgi:hypothetical protein